MCRAIWLVVLAASPSLPGERGAVAGTVRVEPRDAPDAGLTAVLVYVVGFEEPAGGEPSVLRQREKHFVPDLVGVTVGGAVTFPNDDLVFHNVFSPSNGGEFDLGQYPREQTRTRSFSHLGVIDVYCNIHPEMAATILVLPNRRFASVGGDGRFRLEGVPPGRWTLYAYSRRTAGPVSVPIEVAPGRTTSATVTLIESRAEPPHRNKYGQEYRGGQPYR